jgi:hypothetical protein
MKQEAIHKSLLMNRIASGFDLAMTVKRAFDILLLGEGSAFVGLKARLQPCILYIAVASVDACF